MGRDEPSGPMTDRAESLWYLAYGSNTDAERLARYLGPVVDAGTARWIAVPHPLYFAGASSQWGGGVAFISLAPDDSAPTRARAYRVTHDQFLRIAARENGFSESRWALSVTEIPVGGWAPLPVYWGGDETKAKYSAVLRLADIDGLPAATTTAGRPLPLTAPSAEYLEACRAGLAEDGGVALVDEYLRVALERTRSSAPADFVRPASAPLAWHATMHPGESTGFAALMIPERAADLFGGGTRVLGTVRLERGHPLPTWILCNELGGGLDLPHASTELWRELGLDGASSAEVEIRVDLPLPLSRRPGLFGDLPGTDEVQFTAGDADRLGRWALAIGPAVEGPVRVTARPHVQSGCARFAYAGRTVWNLTSDGDVMGFQRIDEPGSGAGLVVRLLRPIGERLIGAPAVALRSVEGLAGDDGRPVVRVDRTALDFLGVEPGQHVVVSWARRATIARVLLQSEGTVQWMTEQLAEKTGRQAREAVGDREARVATPEHLRVWVSARVRTKLDIPPDSVVRLRRSLRHLLLRNAASLTIPVGGLLIAGFAIPDVWWPVWLVVAAIVLFLAAAPLYLSDRRG